MAQTNFSGPVDSKAGFKVNGTEVIDANGRALADNLAIGATGLSSSTIGTVVPMIFPDAPDTRADAGAISIGTYYTYLTTTGAAAMTLPNGAILGQIKKLHMTIDGGDATVTPATFDSGTTITFADVGDVIELMWLGTANGGWVAIAAYNIANGDAGPAVA